MPRNFQPQNKNFLTNL